jgi:hypothetical protein
LHERLQSLRGGLGDLRQVRPSSTHWPQRPSLVAHGTRRSDAGRGHPSSSHSIVFVAMATIGAMSSGGGTRARWAARAHSCSRRGALKVRPVGLGGGVAWESFLLVRCWRGRFVLEAAALTCEWTCRACCSMSGTRANVRGHVSTMHATDPRLFGISEGMLGWAWGCFYC